MAKPYQPPDPTPRERQVARFEAEERARAHAQEQRTMCDRHGHLFAEHDCCIRCGHPELDPFDDGIPF